MAVRRRRCKRCGRNRAERFFTSERGTVCTDCQRRARQTASRNSRLQETYGITEAEYQRLFEAQGGRCAICGGKRRTKLDVDHCHATGKVRGLLCRRCNRRLLPASQDRIEVLEAAIKYLLSPPAVEVIGERIVPNHDTV